MNEPALVHIVDDDADVRESLSMLLSSVNIQVAAYPNADNFVAQFRPAPKRPGCLLLDVRMPGLGGMALLERLHRHRVQLPVIMLTGHGDIPMSVRAMKLGAVDFITKPFNSQKLLELVQRVLQDPLLQSTSDTAGIDPRLLRERWETLTPREREVFEQLVTGASNRAVSNALGIGIRTVETHRAHLMEKLRTRTLVDLVLLKISLRKHTSLPPADT